MKIVDAIAEILKREGVEFLSAYPTTPVIDAAAAAGIRPVLCRQERVGRRHRRRLHPNDEWPTPGSVCHAVRPGGRERLPRRRYRVLRFGPDAGAAARTPAGAGASFPALQLGPHLCLGDEMGGDAEPAGPGRRGDAARVQPPQDGPAGPGHGRDPGRRGPGGGKRSRAQLQAGEGHVSGWQSLATWPPPRGPSCKRSTP